MIRLFGSVECSIRTIDEFCFVFAVQHLYNAHAQGQPQSQAFERIATHFDVHAGPRENVLGLCGRRVGKDNAEFLIAIASHEIRF